MSLDLIHVNDLATATLDDSDQVIIGEYNTFKKATVSALKGNILGSSPSYTTDTEPYTMRRTKNIGVVGKCVLNKLVGGSLGWNQLVQNGNFANTGNWTAAYGSFTVSGNVAAITATAQWGRISQNVSVLSGHKYLFGADLKGTINNYVQFGTSQYLSGTSWEHITFLYSATSTTTVQLMIGDKSTSNWQAFNAQNVQVFDLTQMFGSMIADYVYSLGTASGVAWLSKYLDLGAYHAYDAGSIQSVQTTAHVTTGKNLLAPWTSLALSGLTFTIGADGSITVSGSTTTAVTGAKYLKLPAGTYSVSGGGSSAGVVLQIVNTTTGAVYEANGSSSTFTYNGTDSLMARIWASGSINTTIYPQVEVGSSVTVYEPYRVYTYSLGSDTLRGIPMLVSNQLSYDGDEKTPDGTITRNYGSRAYQSGDTSDGATMITNGTTTVYKLATPTTESSTSFQRIQTISADGTESFTTSTPVPVGHETQTPDNILAALNWVGE